MEEELQFSFEEAFNKLNRKPSLFKDEKFLNINFSSEILHRQEELNELLRIYSTLINNPGVFSVNQFVLGKSGTGKTCVTKYFSRELIKIAYKYKVPLRYVHVNCRKEKSSYGILTSILTSLKKSFPKRGYSPEDLVKILNEYLNEKKIYLLVILDELDYAIEDNSSILYYLTRISEESTSLEQIQRLSIIGILKNISLIEKIYDDIGHFFHEKDVEFKPYNQNQLFDILKSKANKSFKSGVIDDELIRYVVSLIKQSGDLRTAMNILWRAGKLAESENLPIISKNCVDLANKEYIHYSSSSEYLKFKPRHLLMFLLCLIKASKANRNNKISTKEVYGKYCELCELRNMCPKSLSQIWNYLQECKKEKILKIQAENNVIGRGRRNYLELSIAPSSLESEIDNLLNSEDDASDFES